MISWATPPPDLSLADHEVHLWKAFLEPPIALINTLRQTLSADELSRAKRFHFEKDRKHFIVARGVLRFILGRYLKAAPGQIRFQYSDYGKPLLASESLRFNLSHSGQLALYAITRHRAIGVDLERLRPIPDATQIAQRFFSAQESKTFQKIPQDKKVEAFFNCWTRKEAYIKAIGEGLSHPLDTFDVSLRPDEPAALLAVRGPAHPAPSWLLRACNPAPDYVAAVIAEGQDWRLKYWLWTPSPQPSSNRFQT